MNYVKKHSKTILTVLLLLICFVLYFINIGDYPLLDPKETKYVSIARDMLSSNDWLTLKLNGNDFYECPPLFFWFINLSFLMFAKISTFTARFPIFIFALTGIIALFLTISKILTKSYALIISLILLTSFGFLLYGRLASIDMIYTITTMAALLLAYLLILSNSKHSKSLLWGILYFLIALSVLTVGLFGFIPVLAIIAMYIFAGRLKDFFKPSNIFPGIIILAFVTLPWFIIMFQKQGFEFIQNSLIFYDLSKDFSLINPLKVIMYFIIGFLPWSFSFLWIIGSKFKDIVNSVVSYFKDNSQDKLKEKWLKLSKVDKFLSINTIVFFTFLIFTLLYGFQHTYLILFLTFPAACIAGYYWYEYMFRKEHDKSIFFATLIPDLLFIICSFAGLFGYNFINTLTVYGYNYLIVPLVIIFFIIPLIGIFSVILKGRIPAFISNLVLMISLAFVMTPGIFNFINANSGELDLINFANKAHKDNVKLAAFTNSNKYSLVYYYDNMVEYHNNNDFEWLQNYLTENNNNYIVVEIKDLSSIEKHNIKYLLLETGKKYCIIKHLPKIIEEQIEAEGEPEVIIY